MKTFILTSLIASILLTGCGAKTPETKCYTNTYHNADVILADQEKGSSNAVSSTTTSQTTETTHCYEKPQDDASYFWIIPVAIATVTMVI